ncbi:MAG: glycosyltransferase family 39 protein [Cyanobacteria bacterium M_surface_10_m2_179]|nr:glycosyltransferase family 39 protein [Cyanobacteria bacterium M_surface_10_m2_179]
MQRLHAWLDQDFRRGLLLAIAALAGLCSLVYVQQLGGLGLMDKTEGLFVEVPRQMLVTGDWVTPRWNGELFFDYPVWGYWMVGLSFRMFGISEWAARLPAALAASATVLALFAVLLLLASAQEAPHRRLGRATLAASVLALSPGWIGWGRSSVTDMFLASATTLALLGFALAQFAPAERPWQRPLGFVGLALFCGVAVLAKGPVGLLLPGLVILVFWALKGRFLQGLRTTPWLALVALFLGVAAPWYGLATRANGMEFLGRFLGFSNLERFTSVIYDHPGPPWFYLPWVVVLLLPWSLFLPAAVARLRCWRLQSWLQADPAAELSQLALVWLVLMLLFFSAAATKLPGYILPVLPAGALLVGLLFAPLAGPTPAGAGMRASGWVNAALLGLMAVAAVLAPRWLASDPSYPGFAAAVARSPLPLLLAVPLAIAAVAVVVLLRREPAALRWLWIPNAAGLAAALALVLPGLVPLIDRERQLPIRQLARLAAEQAHADEPLLVVGYKRYSVVFYSGRPVLFVGSARKARRLLEARRQHPASVLLLGSDQELLEFGIGPGDGTPLGRRDAHRLMRLPLQDLKALSNT